MTVKQAVEIRDRAIALGLYECCDDCREAIDRLMKLGSTNEYTLTGTPTSNATYPQNKREPTIGLGQEDAARYLRRQIGAPNVVA
jgi:hypothetical protein